MILLALGVALWSAVHFLPSVAPALRERVVDSIGPGPYRGLFSLSMLVSLILIVLGYQQADWIAVYDPPSWGIHLNNLLMLVAIYLFGVGGAKGWLATKLRHPQLLGTVTWATAHLLANGDEASVLLFGGMALWAVGMIFMINRRTGAWSRPKPRGAMAEIMLVVITLVVFGAIMFAHWFIFGVRPVPG